MDYMKKATCQDYTTWDLNCPRIIHIKNRQKMEAKFKRKARRKEKQSFAEIMKERIAANEV